DGARRTQPGAFRLPLPRPPAEPADQAGMERTVVRSVEAPAEVVTLGKQNLRDERHRLPGLVWIRVRYRSRVRPFKGNVAAQPAKSASTPRRLYSTDASIYQVESLGVVILRTAENVIATMQVFTS